MSAPTEKKPEKKQQQQEDPDSDLDDLLDGKEIKQHNYIIMERGPNKTKKQGPTMYIYRCS